MLKALKFLYSVWIVTWFFIITVPMLITFLFIKFLPYEKQIHGVYIVNRSYLFLWSIFSGFRYKIYGLEHIDRNKTYVVVGNHLNAADMIALAYGQRVPAKPLVKKELQHIPILGQIFALSCLPVDRSSKEGRKASKVRMLSDLKKGISILILPEGTRNRTPDPLKSFYNGAFELAIEAGVPILPVVMTNIRKINKVDTLLIQPGVIEVHHLPEVSTANLTLDDMETLKNKVHGIMWQFLLENDDNFKNSYSGI
jgi:1-acyl-sn-glycerol-3-phosphate acyltransferase